MPHPTLPLLALQYREHVAVIDAHGTVVGEIHRDGLPASIREWHPTQPWMTLAFSGDFSDHPEFTDYTGEFNRRVKRIYLPWAYWLPPQVERHLP